MNEKLFTTATSHGMPLVFLKKDSFEMKKKKLLCQTFKIIEHLIRMKQ